MEIFEFNRLVEGHSVRCGSELGEGYVPIEDVVRRGGLPKFCVEFSADVSLVT